MYPAVAPSVSFAAPRTVCLQRSQTTCTSFHICALLMVFWTPFQPIVPDSLFLFPSDSANGGRIGKERSRLSREVAEERKPPTCASVKAPRPALWAFSIDRIGAAGEREAVRTAQTYRPKMQSRRPSDSGTRSAALISARTCVPEVRLTFLPESESDMSCMLLTSTPTKSQAIYSASV